MGLLERVQQNRVIPQTTTPKPGLLERVQQQTRTSPQVTAPKQGLLERVSNNPNIFAPAQATQIATTTPIPGQVVKPNAYLSGGKVSDMFDIVSTGAYASAGLLERTLQGSGVLAKTEDSGIIGGVKSRKSNIETLKQIGEQRGGGVLFGRYEPSQNQWSNFVKELPVTVLGVGADIVLDPLTWIGGAGLVKRATSGVGGLVAESYKSVASNVPAVQKIGQTLERVFMKRGGQSEAFKDLDRLRLIDEDLLSEKNVKLTSEVIDAPIAIQQRVAQVLKGGITTNPEIQRLAAPIREELDQAGEVLSRVNPSLLSEATFVANKGKYLGNYFTKYVAPADETAEVKNLFKAPGQKTIKTAEFKQRLDDYELAKTIDQNIVDVETKIKGIIKRTEEVVDGKKADLAALVKEISALEKQGLKIALSKKEQEAFQELTALIEKKEGSYFRRDPNLSKEIGKNVFTQVGVNKVKLVQPTLKGRSLKENIERLIFAPDAQIEKLQQLIGRKNAKLADLLDEILFIRKDSRDAIGRLPNRAHLKSMAEQARLNMGLIREAGFPALMSLEKTGKAAIRSNFFKSLVERKAAVPLPDDIRRFQLPDSASLGAAAGHFVNQADFAAIMKRLDVPSGMAEFYQKALRVWKSAKTAFNPSTIARNDITNFFMLNPLGGVGPHRIDLYFKALNEFSKEGSELWKRFRKVGGGMSSQTASELVNKAADYYRGNPTLVKQFFKTPAEFSKAVINFYGNQDTFFKFTNFIKGITEDGLDDFAAMKRANFYLIDYSEVPAIVEWMRKSPIGAPFISFTYGVSLPLAKTLLQHPEKLAAYGKILRGFQSMSEPDTEEELRILPDNLKGQPFDSLKLPFVDKFGREQYLDLRYILPTNLLESYTLTPFGLGQIPLANQFGQNPLIQSFAGFLTNKNPFTGKDIVAVGSTKGEATMAFMDFFQKQILPSLAPGVPVRVGGQMRWGGFSLDKVIAALQKRPDFAGRERDLGVVGADVLGGLKVQQVDMNLQQRMHDSKQRQQLEEIRSQMIRIQLSKILTEEEKKEEMERIKVKIEKIISE